MDIEEDSDREIPEDERLKVIRQAVRLVAFKDFRLV